MPQIPELALTSLTSPSLSHGGSGSTELHEAAPGLTRGSSSIELSEALVRLPDVDRMRRMLSGVRNRAIPTTARLPGISLTNCLCFQPFGPGPTSLRIWASSCTLMGLVGGWLAFSRIQWIFHDQPDAPEIYHFVKWESLVVCMLIGMVSTEGTILIASATTPPRPNAPTTPKPPQVLMAAPTPNTSWFFQKLVASEVSPEVERQVRQQLRRSSAQVLVPLSLFCKHAAIPTTT